MRKALAAFGCALALALAPAAHAGVTEKCSGPVTVSATGLVGGTNGVNTPFELAGARGPVSVWVTTTAGTLAANAYCYGPTASPNWVSPRARGLMNTALNNMEGINIQRAFGDGPCNALALDVTICTACSALVSFCAQGNALE